jgi:hypothetical protein
MYDNDFEKLEYNYFNEAPIIESVEGNLCRPGCTYTNETIFLESPGK